MILQVAPKKLHIRAVRRVGWFRILGYFIQNIGGTRPETNSEFTPARLRLRPKRKRESLPTTRFSGANHVRIRECILTILIFSTDVVKDFGNLFTTEAFGGKMIQKLTSAVFF